MHHSMKWLVFAGEAINPRSIARISESRKGVRIWLQGSCRPVVMKGVPFKDVCEVLGDLKLPDGEQVMCTTVSDMC